MSFVTRKMQPTDWAAVSDIYGQGITTGNATFETDVPAWEKWDATHHPEARLVACEHGVIVGWAALSPVSARAVYAGVAEVSVYVSVQRQNQGIGRMLLKTLVEASEEAGVWTLQASIFPENELSLSVHKKCGFRQVGYRERLAKLKGSWRDVILLERRSSRVGKM